MIYIFAVVVLFLISTIPTKKNKKMEWMKGYSFHRGKFCEDQSIPENSIAAIVEAIKMKADIEIDIRITADNVLVVFHDESLHRMCNVDGLIENMTYDAIQEYSLKKTKEHIPTFEQVLHVVDGQINLIIEIKPTSRVDQVCTLVMEHLFDYQGNYAICSFHPMIVTYFKKYFHIHQSGTRSSKCRFSGRSRNGERRFKVKYISGFGQILWYRYYFGQQYVLYFHHADWFGNL